MCSKKKRCDNITDDDRNIDKGRTEMSGKYENHDIQNKNGRKKKNNRVTFSRRMTMKTRTV